MGPSKKLNEKKIPRKNTRYKMNTVEDMPPEYELLLIKKSIVERPPDYSPPPEYVDAFSFPIILPEKHRPKTGENAVLIGMLDQLSSLNQLETMMDQLDKLNDLESPLNKI